MTTADNGDMPDLERLYALNIAEPDFGDPCYFATIFYLRDGATIPVLFDFKDDCDRFAEFAVESIRNRSTNGSLFSWLPQEVACVQPGAVDLNYVTGIFCRLVDTMEDKDDE